MAELGFDSNSHRLHEGYGNNANVNSLIQQIQDYNTRNENSNYRFSRSQSALDLATTGKVKRKKTFWEELATLDKGALKQRVNELAGKIDENFADSLRPVTDWIDKMQFHSHTAKTGSRDHENRRIKDAMYAAKGKRDALNSELEQAYLKPILKEIAAIAKKTKGKSEEDIKGLVGGWLSVRYSIEKNTELLETEQRAMSEAKQKWEMLKSQGASIEDINQAEADYQKAERQYRGRKADVESRNFSNDRKYQVGVAGGWSIPLAREIMKNTDKKP